MDRPLGKSPFQIPLNKALRHFKAKWNITVIFSLDSSESFYQGIKAMKNSIGIPSEPQAFLS